MCELLNLTLIILHSKDEYGVSYKGMKDFFSDTLLGD